jgi:DNA-binding MarR family transcriptional regulator
MPSVRRHSASLRGGTDLDIIYEVATLIASGFRAFVSDPAARTRHGATPAQLRLLQLVAMQPGISVTEAADGLAITNASASTALARLSTNDWVTRHSDPNDARCTYFKLNNRGKKVLAEFERIQTERIDDLLARFSKKDIKLFRSLTARVTSCIEDMYG